MIPFSLFPAQAIYNLQLKERKRQLHLQNQQQPKNLPRNLVARTEDLVEEGLVMVAIRSNLEAGNGQLELVKVC